MNITIILQLQDLVTNEMQTGRAASVSTQHLESLLFLTLLSMAQHCLTHSAETHPAFCWTTPAKSYLLQGWRILNFYRCDVEPRPFILAKYKRMKQFVFIRKAALSQQQSPQLSCYGRITPNPQSISVRVFFYGGKMFTVRMPNSSKEVNWWVNQICFLESD